MLMRIIPRHKRRERRRECLQPGAASPVVQRGAKQMRVIANDGSTLQGKCRWDKVYREGQGKQQVNPHNPQESLGSPASRGLESRFVASERERTRIRSPAEIRDTHAVGKAAIACRGEERIRFAADLNIG